jgi:protein-S-isoprenylcysteine O-methyltransferase Ste14
MDDQSPIRSSKVGIKTLIGSADRIWLMTGPVLAVGLVLNILFPAVFSVGGPSRLLRAISWLMLIPGVIIWFWSVELIATKARRGNLITTGPFALVKHPIYTSVGILVFPSFGFLLNTWLGALVGAVLYIGTRIFAPEEEVELSKRFGPAWDEYCRKVKLFWL